jgi:hypothetical protein
MKTTEKKPRRNWRPFEEARSFVHSLGLKSKTEWDIWSKTTNKPADIPISPLLVYKNQGWIGWEDDFTLRVL